MKRIFTNLLLLAAMLLPATTFAQGNCNDPLPWTFDFEGLATGGSSFVPCWTRVDSARSSSAVYPNIFSFGSTHGNVLNFNGNSASQNGTMRAATPLIPAPLNALDLSFTVYKSTLKVYAATDPYDQSTYVLIGSYSPGYNWTTYEVRTNTITGMPSTQGYLVFTADFGSGFGHDNPYLDDLTISPLNACQRTDFINITNITPNTAALGWGAVDGRQGYRVSYSDVNNLQNATSFDVPSNTASLSNLTPGTKYYVWVQTICSETSISDPRLDSFYTELACYSIIDLEQTGSTFNAASFSWNFTEQGNARTAVYAVVHDLTDPSLDDVEVEMEPGATSNIFFDLNNTHQYEITFYTICGQDTAEGVSTGVYFRNCGESILSEGGYDHSDDCPLAPGYDNSYSVMLYEADVLYSMDSIRGIALHRTLVGSDISRRLNIFMGHTTLDSLTSNPGTAALTQVATNHLYNLPLQEWDTLMFDNAFAYDGSSNVLVAIRDVTGSHPTGNPAQWYWHNADTRTYYSYGTSSVTRTYHRPDIRFVGECNNDMSCEAPAVIIDQVDSNNAVVSWFGEVAQYIVEYRLKGTTAWTVADTNEDLSYTLTGLQPATHYEVRVGINCGTLVRYSAVVGFETECALVHIPFHFTQMNMLSTYRGGGFSSCWDYSQYFYLYYLTESEHACVFSSGNDGQWFMLPPMAEPLQGARLRTWVASSDQGWFKVGVANESDCSDVVWVDTVLVPASNVNTSHDEYVSYLDTYTGDGRRVVVSPIANNNFHNIFFFDFHIEPIENCRPPVNLALDSASANTLYVSWTPVGAASEWAVYVGGVRRGVTSTPNYAIGGLDAYSYYDVQVRALCGEDDSSAVATGTFLTDCEGESCYITIAARSASGDGWRGGHLVAEAGNITYDFTMLRDSETSETLLVCNSDSVKFQWYSGNDDEVCSFNIIGPTGDTLITIANAYNLQRDFFAVDSVCGRAEPGPGPGPGGDTNVAIAVAEAMSVMLTPNPASTMFTVSGLENGSTLSLIDACGREVLRTDVTGSKLDVNVDGYAKGIYFVRIANRKAVVTRKIVVK